MRSSKNLQFRPRRLAAAAALRLGLDHADADHRDVVELAAVVLVAVGTRARGEGRAPRRVDGGGDGGNSSLSIAAAIVAQVAGTSSAGSPPATIPSLTSLKHSSSSMRQLTSDTFSMFNSRSDASI